MTVLRVGIDIGGTKTHMRAAGAGAPADLILPTNDWRVREWEKDAISLLEFVRRFAGKDDIAALAIGAHGCDSQAECDAFERALAQHASFPVRVVNDAELLPAALGLEHEIGLVAGTGSIAVCRSPATGMLVAGGWGWVIGDEGSSAGLVREAARAISLHIDKGGAEDEPLINALIASLGIDNAGRIGRAIVKPGGAAELGRHAYAVFEAEKQGSLLARQVIIEGARHLVDLVARLKANGAQATIVVAGGGVIAGQPRLADAFLDELARRFNGEVTGRIFARSPVEGACRLAEDLSPDLSKLERQS
ncbi:N-acetylglucosamine kinase [Taklimakanibacter deserti]|uniref:N-acetylglucosamine kinase n=1 Tax=Taklimakanibacter deserti TaxID=2267839 RepID=UPI000E6558DB